MRFELPEGHTAQYRYDREPREVSFNHSLPDAERVYPRWVAKRRSTFAMIVDAGGLVVAVGAAICRPDEQFTRCIGRDIARGRALKMLADNGPLPNGSVVVDEDHYPHLRIPSADDFFETLGGIPERTE